MSTEPEGPEPIPSADAEAAPAQPRPSRTALWGWRAVSVVFFVGAVVMAVLAARLSSQLDNERGDRRAVERVSSDFARRLLTYDYRHLDAAKRAVLALSTGKFRGEYEQAFKGGLDQLLRTTKATSRGSVTDVYVSSIDGGTASSIAVVDAAAQGTSGTRRSVASYIQLDLVKVKGTWRVDGVTNLNFGQTGPTTTVPAPSK